MMTFILLLCRALRAGESLTKAATWKQRQLRINALAPVIYLLTYFCPVDLTPDDVDAISTAVGMIGLGLINGYLTVATTVKIGLGGSGGES